MRTAVLIVFMLLCHTGAPRAEETPLRAVGRTLQPCDDVPVRLAVEDVRITIDNTQASVSGMVYLVNEGPPGEVRMGFTRGWDADILDFVAHSNVPLAVETGAGEPSDNEFNGKELPWWKVFSVEFRETGEAMEIMNKYRTTLRPVSGNDLDDLLFTYIMRPGALWKGTIETAEITVYLDNIKPDQVTLISPEGYVRDSNRIIWRYKDFEPDKDIQIALMRDVLYYRLMVAENALEEDPRNAHAHYLIGTVRFNRDFPESLWKEETEQAFLKAIEYDPLHLDARWFLAVLYYMRNNDSELVAPQLEAIVREKGDVMIKEFGDGSGF